MQIFKLKIEIKIPSIDNEYVVSYSHKGVQQVLISINIISIIVHV